MTINTILVPFDFSPSSTLALEKACQLGQQLEAQLHLVNVREGSPDVDFQRHALDRGGGLEFYGYSWLERKTPTAN